MTSEPALNPETIEEENSDETRTEADTNDSNEKDSEIKDVQNHFSYDDYDEIQFDIPPPGPTDPNAPAQKELIATSTPTTELEIALSAELDRQNQLIERLQSEVSKLKTFISKRKQTYKRKRKEEEAPRKSLSAYNLFVRERFAKLAKENESALKSGDVQKQLTRIPPAMKVAEAGHAWRALTREEKAKYEAMAKPDKERYEEQMANYQAPEKQNRKRNKTGYNLFFSAHVLRMKSTDSGVPSERGSVARLVGDAWKKMSAEDKDVYEREADKINDLPPEKEDRAFNHNPSSMNIHPGSYDRPPLMVNTMPSQARGPPPPPNYGPLLERPPDYAMGPPPPIIHQPGVYYDSRYGPPPPPGPYGGYDYYGYPPLPPMHQGGPPLGQQQSTRGHRPTDSYAIYENPPPDYRGPPATYL